MGSGGQIKNNHLPKKQAQKQAQQPAVAPAPPPHWPDNYRMVAPGSTALSREAEAYRERHDLWSGVNVAVVEYVDAAGEKQTLAAPSGNGHHSERNALDQLRAMGVPLSNVTQIYTEREPCCLPGAYCAPMLERELPGVPVTFSYEYGEDHDSRGRGNQDLRGDLRDTQAERGAEGTPLPEQGTDAAQQEEQSGNRLVVDAIREHFKDDPAVLQIMNGVMSDKPLTEIRKEMGLSPTEFKKAMDRFRTESRAIAGD